MQVSAFEVMSASCRDTPSAMAISGTEVLINARTGRCMFVSTVANGCFTITHANSAKAGRTFLYATRG
jgi:hypothetical protein